MGHVNFILIAGIVFLLSADTVPKSLDLNPGLTIVGTVTVALIPALLAYIYCRWVVRYLPASHPDRVQQSFLIKKSMIAFEILMLVGYVCDIYFLYYPYWVSKWMGRIYFFTLHMLISILPLVIGTILIRLVSFEFDRYAETTAMVLGDTNSGTTRRQVFKFQTKLLLLPLLPMFAYYLLFDVIEQMPTVVHQVLNRHLWVGFGLMGMIILAAFIYAPFLLNFLWPTRPLDDSELGKRLRRLAEQNGIKYRDIVVWQTRPFNIANAAVAGLAPWSRRIFLTDILLDSFSSDEIETIVAHEFGHIRYKHILTYFVFSLTYFFSYALLYVAVGHPILVAWDKSPIVSALYTIVFLLLYFVFIFRFLSRRFEYQADLYAVNITRRPVLFKQALYRLANMNFIPRSLRWFLEIFSTHPSIERRFKFIDLACFDDPTTHRYRTYLLEAKILVILLPILVYLTHLIDLSRIN